jgi:ketosteroid isomerase-like protein
MVTAQMVTEHPNVALIKAGYAAFAAGDFAALDDMFAEDLLWHEPGRNQLAGDFEGRDAVYAHFGRLAEVMEGSFHMDVEAVFADDDRGVALVRSTGSRGGRTLTGYGANIFRLRDGKVVEFWGAPSDPYGFDELIG